MKRPLKTPAQAHEEFLLEKVRSLTEALRRAQIAELDAIQAREQERTPAARMLMDARMRERLRTQQLVWEAEALLEEHRQKRGTSKVVASGERPNARKVDYEEIRARFRKLVSLKGTETDARSVLRQQLANEGIDLSTTQLWRITTGKTKKTVR